MKKIFFIISILSSVYSFGQCVNLYVKEHIDGDPICRLSAGSALEICLGSDSKTINGGACTFYIQSSRMNGDVQIYEFGLDKSTMYFYAPKYGELIINTKTKKFGFSIDNNYGTYSYYSEAEMQKMNELDASNKNKLDEQKKLEDENTIKQINKALEENKYFLAYNLLNDLSFENNSVKAKVLEKWNPLKQELDLLFKEYLVDFELFKSENLIQYNDNPISFLEKNKELITKVKFKNKGYKDINLAIQNGYQSNSLAFLEKSNNKYLFLPVGQFFHYYSNVFDTIDVDQIVINTKYNQTTNDIEPEVNFYKNNKLRYNFKVINRIELSVNSITYNYSEKLSQIINSIISQGGESFIETNYKIKQLFFDSKEVISFQSKTITKPENGYQNKDFDRMISEYSIVEKNITPFITEKPDFIPISMESGFYKILLHSKLISKLKKINEISISDSLVLIFVKYSKEFPEISNTIKLQQVENGFGIPGSFYFIPLKKGKIELISGNNLRIYNSNGNYKDFEFNKLCQTYTNEKLIAIESNSNEINKLLKKNNLYYVYSGFKLPSREIEPYEFRYSSEIIIPKFPVYDFSQKILYTNELTLPPNNLFKVVFNK